MLLVQQKLYVLFYNCFVLLYLIWPKKRLILKITFKIFNITYGTHNLTYFKVIRLYACNYSPPPPPPVINSKLIIPSVNEVTERGYCNGTVCVYVSLSPSVTILWTLNTDHLSTDLNQTWSTVRIWQCLEPFLFWRS